MPVPNSSGTDINKNLLFINITGDPREEYGRITDADLSYAGKSPDEPFPSAECTFTGDRINDMVIHKEASRYLKRHFII